MRQAHERQIPQLSLSRARLGQGLCWALMLGPHEISMQKILMQKVLMQKVL
jgi:hypothetical protein